MKPLGRIRALTAMFVVGLVVSGLTAFPMLLELRFLEPLFQTDSLLESWWPAMAAWLQRVLAGYEDVYSRYPFVGYGTDWMAFAHLVIATAFWGVWRDPWRNIWVVEWAMLACVGIVPLAVICGQVREIPWFWTVVDCSFGAAGLPILWALRRSIQTTTSVTSGDVAGRASLAAG